MGPLIVLALRLIGPLFIFRWPFWAGLVSMVVLDGCDVVMVDLFGYDHNGAIGAFYEAHYHQLDKVLDSYYLTLELLVSLRWDERIAKVTSIWLYIWRMVGVVLFELTQLRPILFFAPNMFENFFLFIAATRKWWPNWRVQNVKRLAVVLFLLYIPKLPQEYILHVKQMQPWVLFKSTFLKGILP